jgi:hypothetical protein
MSETGLRDSALDFVKGSLVLAMIAYHVMSIMSNAEAGDFRYLRFISGSFVFASGYIAIRFSESAFRREPVAVTLRLIARGAKVIAIFSALNLLIYATGIGNVSKSVLGSARSVTQVGAMFIHGSGKTSSFFILLPIGYLQIVAPGILRLSSINRRRIALLLLAAAMTAAALPKVTDMSAVLEVMLIGIAGMACGLLAASGAYQKALTPPNSAIALTCLTLALWFTGRFSDNTATYTVGIAFALLFFHDLGRTNLATTRVGRCTILLGRYSLPAYIAQIALIQGFFRLLGLQRLPLGFGLAECCIAVAAALIAMCFALEFLRARSLKFDRIYRMIFS